MEPGCIVRCRNRDWVLLPSEREDLYLSGLFGSLQLLIRMS